MIKTMPDFLVTTLGNDMSVFLVYECSHTKHSFIQKVFFCHSDEHDIMVSLLCKFVSLQWPISCYSKQHQN